MTQSGQGHDPQNSAAGPAREGIVLPAGGGDAWPPDQQAAPPAGQPWGQPWGPGQQPPAPQGFGQSGAAPSGPQPHSQTPSYGYPAAPQAPAAPHPPQQGFPPPSPSPAPPMPAAPPPMPPQAPHAGPPAAGPMPPNASAAEATTVLPPVGGRAGQQPGPSGELVRATPQAGAPLPPAAGDDATTLLPPVAGAPGGPGAPGGAPLPPESAAAQHRDAATQMLRPIKAQQEPPRSAQPMPQSQPMPGAGADQATQLIPPISGAGGPVGAGAPTPPPGAQFGAQPGAPGGRSTPAEFDGLFRDGPAAPAAPAPDATAQLPRFGDAGHPPYGQQPTPGGPFVPGGGQDQYAPYEESGGGRRKIPAAVVVGAIVVALAGVGLGVGWALSGGSGDDTAQKKQQDPGTSTAKSTKDGETKPADDPAAGQAKGLDALLADSNNSRSAVIGAVQNIKGCTNLGGAAGDLRSAAGQRNDLVKRLQQLPVDKIPNSAQLTAALTTAWKSSADADNHYAAWADKVAGKGGCDKGHAKGGKEASQGNASSGAATKAKQQAAGLWNPIAEKYGLRKHSPEQL